MHHYWYGNEIISTLIKLENDRIVCIQQAKIIVRCHVKQKNNPTNFDPAHRCTTSNTKPHTQTALLWIPNPADFPIYKLLEELWSYCNYPAVSEISTYRSFSSRSETLWDARVWRVRSLSHHHKHHVYCGYTTSKNIRFSNYINIIYIYSVALLPMFESINSHLIIFYVTVFTCWCQRGVLCWTFFCFFQ